MLYMGSYRGYKLYSGNGNENGNYSSIPWLKALGLMGVVF